MLDADTKRRIDSCRDMLVGKVPDPKSQVEQITIALIYKFMDDMDAEAEELGGERSFFAGDYARYGWAKLMSPTLGGFEMLGLYSEGIDKMPQNPGVPLLFREIFKNAYLPYKDPETLRAFLREINGFSYDHSERLGDAFEYLLSVLGSQGDAGQFRTPRHIIDFMVDILAPQKGEKILDPACGTAGFLISSYKYIQRTNTRERLGDELTPEDRSRLARQIVGYDISPDMVRLSLVNLYLHGFTDPHIEEYDTLTNDAKWNEQADVILANPPFMSPKGGIKPHKRFSVPSNRSEVLFVDYIANHLTSKGRAGIIVPEGVIFQSGGAYKQLRELLVKKYLIAVVSLPAGVFQPYSGVKTSILLLDRRLAKKADSVLFLKVNNDGFSLGAQRRAIAHSDLPAAARHLKAWTASLETDTPFETDALPNAHTVSKAKFAASTDYNLSGDRYATVKENVYIYELAELEAICDINPESINPTEAFPGQEINYIDISSVENETGRFTSGTTVQSMDAPSRARRKAIAGDVLISTVRPNLKAFTLLHTVPEKTVVSTGFAILRAKPEIAIPEYIISMLRSPKSINQMMSMMGKGAYPSINQADVQCLQIPLPPLSVQQEIVAEIEGYQKVIDGARQVVENYKPRIDILPEWPMVALQDVSLETQIGLVRNMSQQGSRDSRFTVPYLKMDSINQEGQLDLCKAVYVEASVEDLKKYGLRDGDFFYNTRNAPNLVGKSAVYHGQNCKYLLNNNILKIRFSQEADPDFINFMLHTENGKRQISTFVAGTTSVAALYQKEFLSIVIPLPNIETQQAIVAEIEAEQRLVGANRELITRFEAKVTGAIDRVWGEG